jgi:hypothetical protein
MRTICGAQLGFGITEIMLCTPCRHGLTPEALKEYQEVRLPTMQMVHEGSAHLAKQVRPAAAAGRCGGVECP